MQHYVIQPPIERKLQSAYIYIRNSQFLTDSLHMYVHMYKCLLCRMPPIVISARENLEKLEIYAESRITDSLKHTLPVCIYTYFQEHSFNVTAMGQKLYVIN